MICGRAVMVMFASLVLPAAESGGGCEGGNEDAQQGHCQAVGEDSRPR